ncbi:type VII secretion integral membrane protein EccD [Pseudonocardia sp. HH130630-07]|uniref:type VII secretion integral membrane protein EccD n=1 Tax=Pseudonocardia sp. HH130630-07 TaxID=1690815 RepID=UPI0009F50A76|nr:type VII secretion integral membrane protein EccD [Pseudonocardia sp. HH130630-07]
MDVAVPAEVPLVDLLPAVLPQFGAETVEAGAEHEGWVVQRLGEPPLDEELTAAQLDLHDGETLHLRPRAEQLAGIDYDDIVAGAGEQVAAHPGVWTATRTRGMLLTGATVLLGLGVPLLWLAGPGAGVLTGPAGALIAAALLGVAALVARGAGDTVVGTVLVGLSVLYGATAAVLVCLALAPDPTPSTALTVGGAVTVAILAVGLVVVADSALLFAGALTMTVIVTVAGLIGTLAGLAPAKTAALTIVVTCVLQLFVSSLAFRLSGLSLPLLPTTPEQLGENIDPVPQEVVVERGTVTVGYTAALHIGLGTAQTPLLVIVALAGGWSTVFAVVTALLLMLRSRHPGASLPRWAMLVPAGSAVCAAVLGYGARSGLTGLLLATLLPTLAVGAGMLWLVDVMPGRRLQPYWGRAVDILETLTSVAMVPILLAVLGVYAYMRGLSG